MIRGFLPAALLASMICACSSAHHAAQQPQQPLVRIAELEIAPAQLAAYTAAVTEEIETSMRVEPGVLSISCVALKDNPAHLRFFEVYADEAA